MISLCAFSDEAGKSLREQIDALVRNGIPYTEIRNVDGHGVASFTLEEAREYKKIMDDSGIRVWSVGSPLGKVDVNCDFRAYLDGTCRHVFELANVFGTDKIRMFSFFKAYEERQKVIEYLGEMVEVAKEYGVGLYHENEKDIYGDTLARVLDIKANVPGLGSIYDPANYLQCGQDADETIAALHASTDYFHVKDVISATGEIVPAGHGDGRIDKIVSLIDRDVTFTLEPHLAIFDGYGNIDNTEMKNKYTFANNGEAFDTAANAFKKILADNGYKETKGGFVK